MTRSWKRVYLQACAVVSQLANAVQREVNNLLANGVVATGKVVGGVLLAADELLGVEQLTVHSSADFIHHGGLQVYTQKGLWRGIQ